MSEFFLFFRIIFIVVIWYSSEILYICDSKL